MHCTFGKAFVHSKFFTQSQPLSETVYNLVPKPEVPKEKPIRYRSVYTNSVKEFYESQKIPNKTMGYYKTTLPCPKNYLKKHARESKAQDTGQKSRYCENSSICERVEKVSKKPPVPRHDERPPMVSNTTKNFIKENIRNVSRTAAKKPVPRLVDSQRGDSILLEFSGLVPKYCTKKEYGLTPKYLVMRQKDMDYSRQKYEEFIVEQLEKDAPKRITESERNELISNLKKNWAEATREYASLPLFIDTIRKKARKEKIEERLKILERDIELLEKHNDIYVLE